MELAKGRILSEITLFLPLKFEHANVYFQFKDFYVNFYDPAEYWFFAKIMRGSCGFCCSSCISFKPTSHLNPFHATGLFRYPLKTSEYKGFLMFSEGIERDQWHEMG